MGDIGVKGFVSRSHVFREPRVRAADDFFPAFDKELVSGALIGDGPCGFEIGLVLVAIVDCLTEEAFTSRLEKERES